MSDADDDEIEPVICKDGEAESGTNPFKMMGGTGPLGRPDFGKEYHQKTRTSFGKQGPAQCEKASRSDQPSRHGRGGGARSKRPYRDQYFKKNQQGKENGDKIDGHTKESDTSSGEAKPRSRRSLHYQALDSLYEKDSKDVVLYLCKESTEFRKILNDEKMTKDYFQLLFRVLARATTCSTVPQNVIYIVSILNECGFFNRHVAPHLSGLMVDLIRGTFNSRSEAMIRYTVTILKSTLLCMPSKFLEISPIISLLTTILSTAKNNGIDLEEDLIEEIETLETDMKQEVENIRTGQLKMKEYTHQRHLKERDEPPNDFRCLSVFPGFADIMTNLEPYLRPNIPKGAFRDADHYLDVQFRLLREDFISPMREGITKYLTEQNLPKGERTRLSDVRIYEDVRILSPTCNGVDGICHVIDFQSANLKRVRWATSKRLLYGSLVCLSKDKFKTLLFATVAGREVSQLENGKTKLKFQNIEESLDEPPDQTFTMIESTAFFEAYRYVLEGLQELDDYSLPFRRHIVECQTDVDIPIYLKRVDRPIYDIRCLHSSRYARQGATQSNDDSITNTTGQHTCQEANVESNGSMQIPVLERSSWPTASSLNLDDSQLKALQSALTREVTVIQGPPGTGKTHIGLKIVEILLSNAGIWQSGDDIGREGFPILIVCYTNHALDQFLEGIYRFLDKGIVRVGSRSKSQTLEKFQISNQRCRFYGHGLYHELKSTERMVETYRDGMKGEINVALDDEELLSVIPGYQKEFLQGSDGKSMIALWLSEKIVSTQDEDIGVFLPLTVKEGSQQKPSQQDSHDRQDRTTENGSLKNTGDGKQQTIDIEGQGDFLNELRTIEGESSKAIPIKEEIQPPGTSVKDQGQSLSRILETLKGLVFEKSSDGFQEDKRNKKKVTKKLKQRLTQLMECTQPMTQEEGLDVTDVWSLKLVDRWRLYKYWLELFKTHAERKLRDYIEEFERLSLQLKEINEEEDRRIMTDAKIIGMTTTGAAKYRSILKQVNPKIVIIEEAAEVLESHIITTLTKDCEHLILIGDHQQLRPNPSVYDLARSYNLDISLFERMIKNGIQYDKLSLQHRMRPEIAELMKHIYTSLQNHDSVKHYEEINGIGKNFFFIEHEEEEELMEEIQSRSNTHEATYLVSLCKYLLQQGYQPAQITILTMYTAQLIEIKHMMPKDIFSGVRVCPVDNFQGEENDIILLSLVRSNPEGSIGFLGIANRVCVALSRARMGFYCIGNFRLLLEKNKLWKKIITDLRPRGNIGKALQLYCRKHPNVIINCSCKDDFDASPDGGCKEPCDYRLDCGHVCKRYCHPYDLDHNEYNCEAPCQILCKEGHPCPLLCHEGCTDCQVFTDKVIPSCGHTQKMLCYQDVTLFHCKEPCPKISKCGHMCTKLCWQACPIFCEKQVEKSIPGCGHTQVMKCSEDPQVYICGEPCEKHLSCSHLCQNKCGEKCSEKCHIPVVHEDWLCGHKVNGPCFLTARDCPIPCNSNLDCGHTCKGRCGECKNGQEHVQCDLSCNKSLQCGHQCTKKCHEDCIMACMEVVVRKVEDCGHNVMMRCCEKMVSCPMYCGAMLRCGHKCSGRCGLCKAVGSHNFCTQKCGRKLICGHTCFKPCFQSCGPCELPHNQFCAHRTRGRDCNSPCLWKCVHHRCYRKCHEPCDRPRCNHPCTLELRCGYGHRCIGLCGDICPNLCRQCNRSQLEASAAFFGRRYTKKSRFVQLNCGHVYEMKDLDRLMVGITAKSAASSTVIGMKSCPKCSKTILNCSRYSQVIKQSFKDIKRTMIKLEQESDEFYLDGAKDQIRHMVNAVIFPQHRSLFNDNIENAKDLQSIIDIEYNVMVYRELALARCNLQNVLLAFENHASDHSHVVGIIPKSFEDDTKQIINDIDVWMNKAGGLTTGLMKDLYKSAFQFASFRLFERLVLKPTTDIYKHCINSTIQNLQLNLRRLKAENNQILSTLIIPSTPEAVSRNKYRSWVVGDWLKCPNDHIFYNPQMMTLEKEGENRDGLSMPHCKECLGAGQSGD
ncbi:NFX1-type zinc finger-containing protein 1-like [Glandiceps talaboti]